MALSQVGLERLNTATTKKIGKNKNLIINGAMQVAQRSTSTTAANGYNHLDRFATISSGLNEATTKSQADVTSGGAYDSGFRKCLKIQNGNQTGGAGAADYISIRYRIEAQDVAQSGWNYTSTSSFITLSFWVKSSVAQNFYGRLRSKTGTSQNYPFETGSLSADTWTKITRTIPGNSNLTFDNDNVDGLELNIAPFFGTNFTDSGVSLNAWAAYASGTRTPDYTSTWYTTNDATFEITGVQLEVSDHATSFQHRNLSEELALCRRYYFGDAGSGLMGFGRTNNQSMMFSIQFPTEMRSNPSMSLNATTLTKFLCSTMDICLMKTILMMNCKLVSFAV